MATQPAPAKVPGPSDPPPKVDKTNEHTGDRPVTDPAPEGAKFDAKDMVADEQRSRSNEIERKGVEQWKADHDDRDPNDRPKQVAGLRKPGEPNPDFPNAGKEAGKPPVTEPSHH